MKNIPNSKCDGCKHIKHQSNYQWCYMFKVEPDVLPCGQHDKYAEQRRVNGKKMYDSMIRRAECSSFYD